MDALIKRAIAKTQVSADKKIVKKSVGAMTDEELREALVKLGVSLTYREHEMEHGIAPAALRDLLRWLNDPEVVRWTDNPVQMGLIGTAPDSDFEFEIPPSHEDGCSCPSSEVRWDYDSIEIFFAFGHVHIGAVNQTLSRVEPTGKQVDLAFSKTEYAPSGFLNRISNHILVPHLILQRGSVYRTTACYTNRDEGYAGVMALWGVWFRNLDNPSVHLNFEDDK